jgi:hypothetical protein
MEARPAGAHFTRCARSLTRAFRPPQTYERRSVNEHVGFDGGRMSTLSAAVTVALLGAVACYTSAVPQVQFPAGDVAPRESISIIAGELAAAISRRDTDGATRHVVEGDHVVYTRWGRDPRPRLPSRGSTFLR